MGKKSRWRQSNRVAYKKSVCSLWHNQSTTRSWLIKSGDKNRLKLSFIILKSALQFIMGQELFMVSRNLCILIILKGFCTHLIKNDYNTKNWGNTIPQKIRSNEKFFAPPDFEKSHHWFQFSIRIKKSLRHIPMLLYWYKLSRFRDFLAFTKFNSLRIEFSMPKVHTHRNSIKWILLYFKGNKPSDLSEFTSWRHFQET